MKTKITVLLAIAMMSSSSFAQNTSTAELISYSDRKSSEGFRIALVKPVLRAKVKSTFLGFTGTSEEKVDKAVGFSAGYASMPIQALGWTGNLTLIDLRNDEGSSQSINLGRIDGNLVYSMNSNINIKGGLNLSKFTKGEGLVDLKPGVGLQASVGVQINKNLGLDFGYTQMRQSGKIDGFAGTEFDILFYGAEVGLHGTF